MSEDLVEICAKVTGRVQGVGFRATVWQLAKHLGLTGTVQNLADGSVKIHVFGKKPEIEAMLETLKKTNGIILVSNIASKEMIPPCRYEDFKIIS